jgi:glycerol-3-phosphate acyltransferase PlsY
VLPALGVWFAVVCATGFVGFGTTVAMATLPLLAWRAQSPLATFCLMMALAVFVAWAHRSNFARMRAGTENRARKLWLFAPKA